MKLPPKISSMKLVKKIPVIDKSAIATHEVAKKTHSNSYETSLEKDKDPRLFTNMFGLLGHPECQADLKGQKVTGLCYNEVECFVNGGTKMGYCGPNPLSGACCVYVHKKCDQTVRRRISYFTNPSFPEIDTEPFACQLSISPLSHTCWVIITF